MFDVITANLIFIAAGIPCILLVMAGLPGVWLLLALAVGIELADKSVLGDKSNVKLRFDPTFMDEAAKGKL